MTIGIVLALAFNVPRIVLMTLAVVYWGKDAFEFWHGAWGGQIFSDRDNHLLSNYYVAAAETPLRTVCLAIHISNYPTSRTVVRSSTRSL